MIGVIGGGAFGTALALALAKDGKEVCLWARDPVAMMVEGQNARHLPGLYFPSNLRVTGKSEDLARADVILIAVPMQAMGEVLAAHAKQFAGKTLVACCKGVDRQSLTGPSQVIATACPQAIPAVLTGPSFAKDIANGLPTALTFACASENAPDLQARLSTGNLRLYLTDDLVGAELGGALKNVIAIACGATMGAGLGESARAATMTRGFAEMQRLAAAMGGRPETLSGLSGFGDLTLTCTSPTSRNYAHGFALGAGDKTDPTRTVEGVHTAQAVAQLAQARGLDLPITKVVADLVAGHTTMETAKAALLARPLKEE
ncbi:MAG: NAD(P)H-dependent glycerol-3-phosphate dehydrogenase [Pseudomonadota bacterium]